MHIAYLWLKCARSFKASLSLFGGLVSGNYSTPVVGELLDVGGPAQRTRQGIDRWFIMKLAQGGHRASLPCSFPPSPLLDRQSMHHRTLQVGALIAFMSL
jgi:hypothetical protein